MFQLQQWAEVHWTEVVRVASPNGLLGGCLISILLFLLWLSLVGGGVVLREQECSEVQRVGLWGWQAAPGNRKARIMYLSALRGGLDRRFFNMILVSWWSPVTVPETTKRWLHDPRSVRKKGQRPGLSRSVLALVNAGSIQNWQSLETAHTAEHSWWCYRIRPLFLGRDSPRPTL